MRKTHLSLIILIFMAILCVAAGASATGQKRSARGSTARPQSTPAASDSSTTLVKLRQELERREAVGELTGTEAEPVEGNRINSLVRPEDLKSLRHPDLSEMSVADLLRKYFFDTQSIYGNDGRVDASAIRQRLANRNSPGMVQRIGFAMDEGTVLANMNSVVALISEERLQDLGNGKTKILSRGTYKEYKHLCSNDSGKSLHQNPVAAFCTGFLVKPNVVATASHCLLAVPLAQTRFVFGFKLPNDSLTVESREVYRAERLIKSAPRPDPAVLNDPSFRGADWALIELDRPVPAGMHVPVKIRSQGKVIWADPLYAAGHPDGLPLTYVDGAFVRNNDGGPYFISNLDTFHGNSGSPVFNARTNLLEGILVRGEEDYEDGSEAGHLCKRAKRCDLDGCRGEDITRANEFIREIPSDTPSLNL